MVPYTWSRNEVASRQLLGPHPRQIADLVDYPASGVFSACASVGRPGCVRARGGSCLPSAADDLLWASGGDVAGGIALRASASPSRMGLHLCATAAPALRRSLATCAIVFAINAANSSVKTAINTCRSGSPRVDPPRRRRDSDAEAPVSAEIDVRCTMRMRSRRPLDIASHDAPRRILDRRFGKQLQPVSTSEFSTPDRGPGRRSCRTCQYHPIAAGRSAARRNCPPPRACPAGPGGRPATISFRYTYAARRRSARLRADRRFRQQSPRPG